MANASIKNAFAQLWLHVKEVTGNPSNLKTINKSNLVEAINEAANIGGSEFNNYEIVESSNTIIPAYTNQLPIATDTDGSIYNSIGYINNQCLNSSGALTTSSGYSTSGFIPAKLYDIIYLSNVNLQANSMHRIAYYNSSKTLLGVVGGTSLSGYSGTGNYSVDSSTSYITKFKITNSYTNAASIAYIRISGFTFASNGIISVNEEITGIPYNLTNTNLSKLTINQIDSAETFEAMQNANMVNEDEIYFIGGEGESLTKAYHVGTTAPDNTNLLWIDTANGLKYHNGSSWVNVPVSWS